MTTKVLQPLDRRDLKRLIVASLENLKDGIGRGIKVTVGYVVEFSVDENISVQTIVDPYQDFPRWKARALAEQAVGEIAKEEEKAVRARERRDLGLGHPRGDSGPEPVVGRSEVVNSVLPEASPIGEGETDQHVSSDGSNEPEATPGVNL